MENFVQLVRKLTPENQEWASSVLGTYALRICPDKLYAFGSGDLWHARFLVAEGKDFLRQLLQLPTIKVWTQHNCAVQGCCFLPASARDSDVQSAITRSLSSNAMPT